MSSKTTPSKDLKASAQTSLRAFFAATPTSAKPPQISKTPAREKDLAVAVEAVRNIVTTPCTETKETFKPAAQNNAIKTPKETPAKMEIDSDSEPVPTSGRRLVKRKYIKDDSSDSSQSMEVPARREAVQKKPKAAGNETENDISSGGPDLENLSLGASFGGDVNPGNKLRQQIEKAKPQSLKDGGPPSQKELAHICKGTGKYFQDLVNAYYEVNSSYSFPSWFRPDTIMDAKKRRPDHKDFDQSTLFVPYDAKGKVKNEDGHSTPMLQQYWAVKAEHLDEVVLFKVGKFYEIFYYDAVFAQRASRLKWMANDKKPHVGFPESSLDYHASMIVDAGYKVIVVEQVETVQEATERTKKSTALLERKMCEVFTAGTVVNEGILAKRPESQYLMSLMFSMERGSYDFAVCLVDCATGDFKVGSVPDRSDRQDLLTLLAQVQPKEILFDRLACPLDVEKLLRNFPTKPQVSPWKRWTCETDVHQVITSPEVRNLCGTSADCLTAVRGILGYLEYIMMAKQVLMASNWSVLSTHHSDQSRLFLDSTALRHLEVLQTSEGNVEGSVLQFLTHTTTAFGKRLLRQWVCAPLYRIPEIRARQDAVQWLMDRPDVQGSCRSTLKSLPDLERLTSRVCALGLQIERGAVLYGDVQGKRMQMWATLEEHISFIMKNRPDMKADVF